LRESLSAELLSVDRELRQITERLAAAHVEEKRVLSALERASQTVYAEEAIVGQRETAAIASAYAVIGAELVQEETGLHRLRAGQDVHRLRQAAAAAATSADSAKEDVVERGRELSQLQLRLSATIDNLHSSAAAAAELSASLQRSRAL